MNLKTEFMEDNTNLIEPLFEKIEEYGKTSVELFKLKALDKGSGFASIFITNAAVILVLSMFTIIVNIGVALWLGDLLGKLYYGFFCVAAFYGVIGIILYFFMRKWIQARISNSIISQMLN